jgi:hypothetical protein
MVRDRHVGHPSRAPTTRQVLTGALLPAITKARGSPLVCCIIRVLEPPTEGLREIWSRGALRLSSVALVRQSA